jgi:hypothetical protein
MEGTLFAVMVRVRVRIRVRVRVRIMVRVRLGLGLGLTNRSQGKVRCSLFLDTILHSMMNFSPHT